MKIKKLRWLIVAVMAVITALSFIFDWSVLTSLLVLPFLIIGLVIVAVTRPRTTTFILVGALFVHSAMAQETSRPSPPPDDPQVAPLVIAGTVLLLAYVSRVAWKAYKEGKKKFEDHQKQIEKGITNCMAAASFPYTIAGTAEDVITTGNFCFEFVMGSGTINNPRIGSADMTMDEFLTSVGLSTTGESHVGDPSIVITHRGNTYTVSVEGEPNGIATVWRSSDATTWTEVGTLKAPKGYSVSFEDAEIPISRPSMFYKIQ